MKLNDTYQLIKTDDGTYSLHSNTFDQLMHSTDGAYLESVNKHVLASNVLQLNQASINILDVGFGIGYNVLATLCEKKCSTIKKINIISLEYDNTALQFMSQLKFNNEMATQYNKIMYAFKSGVYQDESTYIKVLFGDARENITTLEKKSFDAIYQDAFSPAKNCELWSVNYFKQLYNILKDNGVITTYSAALQVRRAMIEANFFVTNFKNKNMIKNGTLAKKKYTNDSLTQEEIAAIFDEIKSTPYYDENLILPRDEILENRKKEMKAKREQRKNLV